MDIFQSLFPLLTGTAELSNLPPPVKKIEWVRIKQLSENMTVWHCPLGPLQHPPRLILSIFIFQSAGLFQENWMQKCLKTECLKTKIKALSLTHCLDWKITTVLCLNINHTSCTKIALKIYASSSKTVHCDPICGELQTCVCWVQQCSFQCNYKLLGGPEGVFWASDSFYWSSQPSRTATKTSKVTSRLRVQLPVCLEVTSGHFCRPFWGMLRSTWGPTRAAFDCVEGDGDQK